MTTISWTRRSSNARPFRGSNSQYPGDVGGMRQSRSVERQSRIPLRSSSSQMMNRDRPACFQRSKSQAPTAPEDTPVNSGKISPPLSSHGSKITPSCSSNRALKKMAFCKDTRNLHDKEYLKEAAIMVQSFFQEKSPEIIINGTDIRPMTIKMFIGMVNFLFEALDIVDKRQEPVRFEISTYEKELPYWMKRLNYPGLITKAWLQTVNVPNNWHHVIGLLSWLVKLCRISALFSFEEQLRIKSEDINTMWQIFYFQQALQAFRIFNEGKEEEYMKLCKTVIQKFYELNGVDEVEVQNLESEIEELQQKLADPNILAEKDALDEAVQKFKNMEAQYLKVADDIAKEEDDIELTKAKILQKEENCESLKTAIAEKKKELEDLKMIVSRQSTTVSEVAELRKKTEYLDKEIKFLEKECEDYSQLISRYEFEAAAKRDTILQSTHAFNRTIIQLEQIIPELKEFRIYQDPENEEIINEMEKMIESLQALKKNKIQTCEELEVQIRVKEKVIKMRMESFKSLTETIEKLEQSIEAKRKENFSLEAEYEENAKSLREKLEKWEGKIKAAEEKMKEFNDLREKHQTLQLRHEQLCRSLEKAEELAEQFWMKAIDKWKHIPQALGNLLELVKAQNVELKKGYSQLMTDLETDVNAAVRSGE